MRSVPNMRAAAGIVLAALTFLLTACGANLSASAPRTSGPVVRIAGTAVTITASFFLNSTDGWAVGTFLGNSGLTANFLVRTTNGGRSWAQLSTGNIQITDLQFITPEVGFALASAGEQSVSVWRSTNAGASWRQIFSFPASPGPSAFTVLHFTSPAWGFASQGRSVVFITGDGTQLSPHLISGPTQPLLTVFQNPANAIVVGAESISTVTSTSLAPSVVAVVAHRTYRLPEATVAFAVARGYSDPILSASVADWGASRVWVTLQLNRCSTASCPSLLLQSANAGGSWQVLSQAGDSLIPGITAQEERDMATASLIATSPANLIGTSVGQFLVGSSNSGDSWSTLSTMALGLADGNAFVPLGADHFVVTTADRIFLVSRSFKVWRTLLTLRSNRPSGSP